MTSEKAHDKHKNPVPAVDFIILNENNSKILLVRRRTIHLRGCFQFLAVS